MAELEDSTFERDLSPVARLLAAHDLPSPSEVFVKKLSSEVNHDDVAQMKEAQEHMLQRFEKTNEMLLNFNALSAARYDMTSRDFKHHTQLLADMKKDLNNVFKRIGSLKSQLRKQFPESFKATQGHKTPTLPEDEEDNISVISEDTAATARLVLSQEHPDIPPTRPSHARNWERAALAHERLNDIIADATVPKIVEPTSPDPST